MQFDENQYPFFLQSYANLKTHFEEQFDGFTPQQKGDYFAEFVGRIIPYTSFGRRFGKPEQSQKTHDGGVDFKAQDAGGNSILFVQSKYSLRDASALETIISKFRNLQFADYESSIQPNLFSFSGVEIEGTPQTFFQVITLHDIKRIEKIYTQSQFSSIDFYNQLQRTNRIEVIDGNEILKILRSGYRKTNLLPSDFEIELSTDLISFGDVHIAIMSSKELQRLYESYGDALFFENLRDFLSSTEVNQEIKRTVTEIPDQLLALNNGVVFKATAIEKVSNTKLLLHEASLVNGCQTTLTIVRSAVEECFVTVKIVQIPKNNSWNITRAANFQNQVKRFDLELAEFLRPQIVKKMASEQGYGYKGNQTAMSVLDAIYEDEIIYEELRSIFIGLFSRRPNNIFDTEYTQLMPEAIAMFYRDEYLAHELFNRLFNIFRASRNIASKLTDRVEKRTDIYRRFFQDNKAAYKAFFTLLASSAASGVDISRSISNPDEKFKLISEFLEKTVRIIDNNPARFRRFYKITIQTVSASDRGRNKAEIQQYLWKYMRETGFEIFLERIHQAADLEEDLDNLE